MALRADPQHAAGAQFLTYNTSSSSVHHHFIAHLEPIMSTSQHIVGSDTSAHDDFTLISTDGVRFSVPTVHLTAIRYVPSHAQTSRSVVFRDMVSCASGQHEIVLLDPELENSAVLRHFLSLITTYAICGPILSIATPTYVYPAISAVTPVAQSSDAAFNVLLGPIKLFNKYDCPKLKDTLRQWLHHIKLPPLVQFTAGAILDDVMLCNNAFYGIHPCGVMWGDPEVCTAEYPSPCRTLWRLLHPSHMSPEERAHIPPNYLFALGMLQTRKPCSRNLVFQMLCFVHFKWDDIQAEIQADKEGRGPEREYDREYWIFDTPGDWSNSGVSSLI
jgi:hypothetical protein